MVKVWDTYFACDECPICEGIEWRLRLAEEGGYEPQVDHCGCEKVQTEFFISGYCEDAFYDPPRPMKKGKRKTGKAYRRAMNMQKKERLIRLLNSMQYHPAAGYVDWGWKDGVYQQTGTYIKYPKNSKWQGFYKQLTNRRIRRGAEIGSGKCGYRRCFDYWWELY